MYIYIIYVYIYIIIYIYYNIIQYYFLSVYHVRIHFPKQIMANVDIKETNLSKNLSNNRPLNEFFISVIYG